jgi:hypothetical protein
VLDREGTELRQVDYERLLGSLRSGMPPAEGLVAFLSNSNRRVAAEREISRLSPAPPPIPIERRLYDIYLAVEDYDRPADTAPFRLDGELVEPMDVSGMEVLLERFGATPNELATLPEEDVAAINAARLSIVRQIHSEVQELLEEAESTERGITFIGEPLQLPAPRPRVPTRTTPPKADTLWMGRHLNRRARELGVAATDVLRKQQGARGQDSRRLRDARALIVAELCDDVGASLSQVATLFDRRRSAIEVLRNKGRAIRQAEKGDSDG